jgi:hypothetical protein
MWIAIYCGAAIFAIAMGLVGGRMMYRALRRDGQAEWLAVALAIFAGLLVWLGGWLILLPYLLIRRVRRYLYRSSSGAASA